MREVALAPEEVATQLFLELLDGARERRLRHVAFFRGPCEIQDARNSQEISDLMHFHRQILPDIVTKNGQPQQAGLAIALSYQYPIQMIFHTTSIEG